MTHTEMQLNINTWKSVAGNVTFWLLRHQFPHMHFKKHDTASWHVYFTTPSNMSLIDHVTYVTVLN